MALIKCPECGNDISNRAPACIYCGYPLENNQQKHSNIVQLSDSNMKSNGDVALLGFSLFSLDENCVNLECKKCSKVYRFNRATNFVEVSEQGCIVNNTICCPNCGNTADKGREIKSKSQNDVKLKQSQHNENQNIQVVSGRIKLKNALLFAILLVGLVVWMFIAPKTLESGNGYKHQVGSFGKCDINYDNCLQDATHRIHHFFGNENYCDTCWERSGQDMFDKLADSSDSSGRKCSACGKRYKDGSDNASSIARTSMCTSCYQNYKWKQDVIDELPIG